jgi:zinc/manganese transport system substrate-binding protein
MMRPLVRAAALAALLLPAAASAKMKVVATLPTLASFASEVGGDRVEVKALVRGFQDPHFVDAKPSLMVDLNKAELLVYVGLDLEIGWLPTLINGARNPRLQTGQPGNLDCSQAIAALDVPSGRVDRSMGDVHPMGNPHYWIPPENAKRVARLIADRLAQLDPEGAADYRKRSDDFGKRVDAKAAAWAPQLAKLKGVRVVTYHRSWTYVSAWLGLDEVGYVEPKPGIPPDPKHIAGLIARMRTDKARLVLMEPFYNKGVAQLVATKSGAKLLTLPTDVGATPEIKDWFDLAGALIRELAAGVE